MCGCCGGQFCPQILSNFLANRRGGHQKTMKSNGKRRTTMAQMDGTLLTPYEVEQLPMMMRELERANRHFWQMVCWRMEQQKRAAKEEAERMEKKKNSKGGGGGGQEVAIDEKQTEQERRRKRAVDDSYADGCALRELVRTLTKSLCENGGSEEIDDECERMLRDYQERLMEDGGLATAKGGGGEDGGEPRNGAKILMEKRREFAAMKGRAISFNGGLSSGGSSSSSGGSTSGYSSSEAAAANGIGRRKAAADPKTKATAWLRQRANSVRGRSINRRCSCLLQQRIGLLGELLNAEFHSTVYAHPEQFDVHERELNVLVWRRFSHLLVALLSEKAAQQYQTKN